MVKEKFTSIISEMIKDAAFRHPEYKSDQFVQLLSCAKAIDIKLDEFMSLYQHVIDYTPDTK